MLFGSDPNISQWLAFSTCCEENSQSPPTSHPPIGPSEQLTQCQGQRDPSGPVVRQLGPGPGGGCHSLISTQWMTNLPDPSHSAGQFCWLRVHGQGHHSLVPTSCWPPVISGSPSAEKEQSQRRALAPGHISSNKWDWWGKTSGNNRVDCWRCKNRRHKWHREAGLLGKQQWVKLAVQRRHSPHSPQWHLQLSLKPSRQDFIIKSVPHKATFPHLTQVLWGFHIDLERRHRQFFVWSVHSNPTLTSGNHKTQQGWNGGKPLDIYFFKLFFQ